MFATYAFSRFAHCSRPAAKNEQEICLVEMPSLPKPSIRRYWDTLIEPVD
jgi:hypothetical protein